MTPNKAQHRTVSAQLEQVRSWSEQIQADITSLADEMAPLQSRLDAAREQLDLVNRLIRLEERKRMADHSIKEPASPISQDPDRKPTIGGVEGAISLALADRGEPMHISEIREALIECGVPLPGRGDEANLIVRLRRAPEFFTRTGRGTYGLRSWELPEVKPRKKRLVQRSRRK